MMKSSRLYHMVLAGVLCAVGIVVPMFMPRIVLGPMSFTLASHVAVFLGMFISPAVAVAVCIGTTLGFFLTTPAIIALRAASHIVFAGLGALYLKKYPDTIDRPVASTVFNFVIALLHAAADLIGVVADQIVAEIQQRRRGNLIGMLLLQDADRLSAF